MNKCVIALQEKDVDGLDRTAGAIRGRAARVIHVVTSEMDNYEPGVYTEKVLEATKLLSNTGVGTPFLIGATHTQMAILLVQALWLGSRRSELRSGLKSSGWYIKTCEKLVSQIKASQTHFLHVCPAINDGNNSEHSV